MAEVTPGIHHIEFWVRDLKSSMVFYRKLFAVIGWTPQGDSSFSGGGCTIYFTEHLEVENHENVGPRHICFSAVSRAVVEQAAEVAVEEKLTIIRGPVDMPQYAPGYYTFDFKDPDGYVLEVAHIPA